MSREFLGEFEELVLLTAAILGEDAYGKNVVDEIYRQTERHVSLSAVHITLYRLEDKGLMKSNLGGISRSKGGRRKRIFTLTNTGLSLLRSMRDIRSNLWAQIDALR